MNGLNDRIEVVADMLGSRKKAVEIAKISRDQLQRYIKGESVPPLDVAARLAQGAGVSVHWLATGEGSMKLSEAAGQGGGDGQQDPAIKGAGYANNERSQGAKINRDLLTAILAIVDKKFLKKRVSSGNLEWVTRQADELSRGLNKLVEENPPDLNARVAALPAFNALLAREAQESADKALVASITYEHAGKFKADDPVSILAAKERLEALIDYGMLLLEEREERDQKREAQEKEKAEA